MRKMMAILLSMKAFKTDIKENVVQVLTDNILTVVNINCQGDQSADLTGIVSVIWSEALANNVTLTAKYLARVENTHADLLPRRIVSTD
jgi:hypothetical protein